MMTVIDRLMRPITQRIPWQMTDGEGGRVTTWTDGFTFGGTISANKTGQQRQGEHDEPTETANLTVHVDAPVLHLFDVIRDADGRTWRITAEKRDFPSVMTVQYRRYAIERWEEAE